MVLNDGTEQRAASENIPVLLLKTKSIPSDGYEEKFSASGCYEPTFVPVLKHQFRQRSLDWLRDLVARGGFARASYRSDDEPSTSFGGIIFTSQRAVEAFAQTVKETAVSDHEELFPPSLPLYVVGPATARGLRATGLQCQILGEDTGNGEALAEFILDHYNGLPNVRDSFTGTKQPLLFPVGEQRREIIPQTLQSPKLEEQRRIEVVESVVYETGEMNEFESNFTEIVRNNERSGAIEQWIVVFSPTGCKAMLRSLGWLDESTERYKGQQAEQHGEAVFVATIGPTTRDFLERELGFRPHVCAEKPSPDGVLLAIDLFRKSKHGMTSPS